MMWKEKDGIYDKDGRILSAEEAERIAQAVEGFLTADVCPFCGREDCEECWRGSGQAPFVDPSDGEIALLDDSRQHDGWLPLSWAERIAMIWKEVGNA